MKNSPSRFRRPGFFRSGLGLALVLIGASFCCTLGIRQLHVAEVIKRSASTGSLPVSMTCLDLYRTGAPASGMVRLTDAEIVVPAWVPMDAPPDKLVFTDPYAFAKTAIRSVLSDAGTESMLNFFFCGDVTSRQMSQGGRLSPFKLPMGRTLAAKAQEELDPSSGLVAVVMPDTSRPSMVWVAEQLDFKDKLSAIYLAFSKIPCMTVHPVSVAPNEWESHALFWGSGLMMSFGLSRCLSVPLGWWVFFSPVGGLLSLLGWPMRKSTESYFSTVFCFLVGGTLMAAAYTWTLQRGGFGTGQADPRWLAAGALALFSSIPILVPAMLELIPSPRLILRMLVVRPRIKTVHSKPSQSKVSAAASATQKKPASLATSYARRFVDLRRTVVCEKVVDAVIEQENQVFERLQFETPLLIEFPREGRVARATVQVGCRNLVLVTTERHADGVGFRLISVLQNGLLILTASGSDVELEPFQGRCGQIIVSRNRAAADVLNEHLDAASALSEKQGTTLVTFESSEWRDILLYADRCLAALQHESGVENWSLTPTGYGRFCYPPQRIDSLQLSSCTV